jgi:hypothetical protein
LFWDCQRVRRRGIVFLRWLIIFPKWHILFLIIKVTTIHIADLFF